VSLLTANGAGLTEGEKEEGDRAKAALLEEAGEAPEDVEGSDDEGGRKKNQFKSHLKTNEAVRMTSARWPMVRSICGAANAALSVEQSLLSSDSWPAVSRRHASISVCLSGMLAKG